MKLLFRSIFQMFSLLTFCMVAGFAQGPSSVLVVVNKQSGDSQKIGDYYAQRRAIPKANVCRISVVKDEEVEREVYTEDIEKSIGKCLQSRGLVEQILYIVTTRGVPLKISGAGDFLKTTEASVDSELAALYPRLKGTKVPLDGPWPNPIFGKLEMPFRHPEVAMYMVTRLAGYDVADSLRLIEHAMAARDTGKVVIDLRADEAEEGNRWLRAAAAHVPKDRLLLEETGKVAYDQRDVIAYASWGSNDFDRHRRSLGFEWLPGAIMTEFVSTDARTFERPPANWTIGAWKDRASWFAGAPQTLIADEIAAGVSGAAGHAYEPYLGFTPRPDALIPAYLAGRNLAESYYVSIRSLSWQNVVIGDPLCQLKKTP